MATKQDTLPVYDFGDVLSIPVKDRVLMSEGHRLHPDQPSRRLLWMWCYRGRRVRGYDKRLRLPTAIAPGGKRFTTVEAFQWWVEQLNRLNRRDG